MTFNRGHAALRKGRVSSKEHIYHVTFTTKERVPYLKEFHIARAVIKAMRFCEQRNDCLTITFCIMPDHVHWLIQLKEKSLSQCVHSVKRYTSNGQLKWAEGYYDSAIRQEEQLIKVARYIIANPKRAKLASTVGGYPHWDSIYLD